ncbi:DUF4064 domain-containing protein [Bacillus sp. Au-Bac7]|uniref:DUF4064 domain-containing protein n=1 Tax=Bacillus sp. Au-Bac7 TaxID=2906458 RepID=UPI001E54ABA7|nr:DUF4064 domain-containing protein [Bacillus sp. Au-Bac7]MCE4052046.1 DUF4064 domain-containing protein [Bacillus sp. Au-Bac7]
MNRTTEYTLSMVAAILLTIAWIIGAIVAFVLGFEPVTDNTSMFFFYYLFTYSLISLPLVILIWVSTFKIKKNSQKWGIFTLVMGVLYTFSVYVVPGVLLLIAGILMVTKNNRDKTTIQA